MKRSTQLLLAFCVPFLLTASISYATTTGTTPVTNYTMSKYNTSTNYNSPKGIAIGPSYNIFVASFDGIRRITKDTSNGSVSSLIHASGVISNATAVAVDLVKSDVYAADSNNRIFRFRNIGAQNDGAKQYENYKSTVVATNETEPTSGIIYGFNPKSDAQFGGSAIAKNSITGMVVDKNQNIYLADGGAHVIWKLSRSNDIYTISLVAGKLNTVGSPASTDTRFNTPAGLAMDSSGALYVADTGNKVVQKITFDEHGMVTGASVVVGQAGQYNGPNEGQSATTPCLWGPKSVYVDKKGGIYIADGYVDLIRYVSNNVIKTVAGSTTSTNSSASYSGSATGARLLGVSGVVVDTSSDAPIIYTTESNNNAVRFIK